MTSDQETIEDDVAARRVRDLVARSQEAALSEVRHSLNSCLSAYLPASLSACLTVYTAQLSCVNNVDRL